MKKVCDKKGFTLAELLIVMAIILILAAIAIPNFTKQLESSRETADINAIRAAYSEAMTEHMLNKTAAPTAPVKIVQTKSGWDYTTTAVSDLPFDLSGYTPSGTPGTVTFTFTFHDNVDGKGHCVVTAGGGGGGGGVTP